MKQCKSYEKSSTNYSLYVLGYLIPHLDSLRSEGKLEYKRIRQTSDFFDQVYQGETMDGDMCGYGELSMNEHYFKGLFFNDNAHGFSEYLFSAYSLYSLL